MKKYKMILLVLSVLLILQMILKSLMTPLIYCDYFIILTIVFISVVLMSWLLSALKKVSMRFLLIIMYIYILANISIRLLMGSQISYLSVTEPETKRTFIAEVDKNFLNRGDIQVYEKKGIFMKKIKNGYFSGEINLDTPDVFINEEKIIISFTFMGPVFSVSKN